MRSASVADTHAPIEIIEFFKARSIVQEHAPSTPLQEHPRLSKEYATRVLLKAENRSVINSFKVRGALFRFSQLSPEQREAGVITSSTGNHAIGVAFAGRCYHVPTTVMVPEGTPRSKIDHAERLGATIVVSGASYADAEANARLAADRQGAVLVVDGNDRDLMIGAGTVAVELLEQDPGIEAILVPVGGGNLIAGVASCAKLINPDLLVIGVQSDAADAVYASWTRKELIERPCRTFASGLATTAPGRLAFDVIRERIDDFVVVSELELRNAQLELISDAGELVEGAGAAAVAALERYGPARWGAMTIAAVLTGGKLDVGELAESIRTTSGERMAAG